MSQTKTIDVQVKEYDRVDGCLQCVANGTYPATWHQSTEKTVRSLLAGGDYSNGNEDRCVEIYIDGNFYKSYTAPEIRGFSQHFDAR